MAVAIPDVLAETLELVRLHLTVRVIYGRSA